MKPYPKYYPDIIQGTKEWEDTKLGIVSASHFKEVMAKGRDGKASTTRFKYMKKIAYERKYNRPAPKSFQGTKAMQYGIDTEDEARDFFAELMETEIKQVGFVKYNDDIGCSPDGLMGKDGLVELKCPETATHMDYILTGNRKLITTYNKQVQGQLFVTGREWCYLVSYDPLWDDRPCLWETIYRDEKLIKEIHVGIVMFVTEMKELMEKLTESPY